MHLRDMVYVLSQGEEDDEEMRERSQGPRSVDNAAFNFPSSSGPVRLSESTVRMWLCVCYTARTVGHGHEEM
jgi:hypothetical protein